MISRIANSVSHVNALFSSLEPLWVDIPEHACTQVLDSNCSESWLPGQYRAPTIWELIHNDTEKAGHGGVTKTGDIDYQPKGRPIGFAAMIGSSLDFP